MTSKLRHWVGLALTGALVTACGHALAPRVQTADASSIGANAVTPPVLTEILSPNFDDRRGTAISAIVLHHTAVTADATSTANFFKDPRSQVSSHYIVDRSGAIIRCVPDAKRAWHAGKSSFDGVGDVNTYSIGIEIANVGDSIEPYPAAQVAAVVKLVAWLSTTYQIPMQRVTRHRDIALPAGRKKDTSDNFDEAYVKTAAQALIDGKSLPAYHTKSAPHGYNPDHQTYVLKPGDTPESLADDTYDTPTLADDILNSNPGVVWAPGTVLAMPTDYEAP